MKHTLFALTCLAATAGPAAFASDAYEVQTLKAQPTLTQSVTIAQKDITATLGQIFPKIGAYVQQIGAVPADAPFARYHLRADGKFDMTAGFPLVTAVAGTSEIQAGELPATRAVVFIHQGWYDTLPAAHVAVQGWIKAQGYQITGDPWESYLSDPGTTAQNQVLTRVVYPIQ